MKDKNGHEFKEGDKLTFHYNTMPPDTSYRCVRCPHAGNVLGYVSRSDRGWPFGTGDSVGVWEITARADGHPPGPVMPDGHEVRPGDVFTNESRTWCKKIAAVGANLPHNSEDDPGQRVLYAEGGWDHQCRYTTGMYKLVRSAAASPAREVLKLGDARKCIEGARVPLLEWDGVKYAPLRIDVTQERKGPATLTVVAEEVPAKAQPPKCVDKHGIEFKVGDSVIDHRGKVRKVHGVFPDHVKLQAIDGDPCDQTFLRGGLAPSCEIVPVDSQGKHVKVGDRMKVPGRRPLMITVIDTRSRDVRFDDEGSASFSWLAAYATLAPLTKAERIAEARKASAEKVREWRDAIAHACLRDNIDHAFHEGERLAAEIAKIQAE